MMSTSASETSSAAADWPIANPSAKLWIPIPVAISSARRLAGESEWRCPPPWNSSIAAAPGPTSGVARRLFSHQS